MTAENSAATAERELVITRVLDAPRELVFQAWTDPEHLVHWWGPNGVTTPVCEMDVRPGGRFRTCMRSPEGREYWVEGVYREVSPPARLVMTWAWRNEPPEHETLVTVTLEEVDGKTRLTLHQALFATDSARDSHESGWSESLDRLRVHAEAAGEPS